jgi:hypothetical protein
MTLLTLLITARRSRHLLNTHPCRSTMAPAPFTPTCEANVVYRPRLPGGQNTQSECHITKRRISMFAHNPFRNEFKCVVSICVAMVIAIVARDTALGFDIAKELFVNGDLHESWQADPVTDPPKMFEGVPPAPAKGDRRLSRAGKRKGGVTAFQYDNANDAAVAYDEILRGMGADTAAVEGLGDQARSFDSVTKHPPMLKMPDFQRAGIVFLRGKTVVYIGLTDMKAEEVIPFAKKIDTRIQNTK